MPKSLQKDKIPVILTVKPHMNWFNSKANMKKLTNKSNFKINWNKTKTTCQLRGTSLVIKDATLKAGYMKEKGQNTTVAFIRIKKEQVGELTQYTSRTI